MASEQKMERGQSILAGCSAWIDAQGEAAQIGPNNLTCEDDWLALACALLTSPIKAEREEGKNLVRTWRKKSAEI